MIGVPEGLVEMLREKHAIITRCIEREVCFEWIISTKKGQVELYFYPSEAHDSYDLEITSDELYDGFVSQLAQTPGLREIESGIFESSFPLVWDEFSSEISPVCVVWRLVREAPDKVKKKATMSYRIDGERFSDLTAAGSAVASASSPVSAIALEPSVAIPVICITVSGYTLEPATVLLLTASQVGIVISEPGGGGSVEVPFSNIHSLEFEGGAYQKGGGFSGGGFGVAGFIVGAASAMALNKLTTKTEMHSEIRILSSEGEIVLYTNVGTPQDLEAALADVRTSIRNAQRSLPRQDTCSTTANLANQLTQLTHLYQSGALTDNEFLAAKSRLLSSD